MIIKDSLHVSGSPSPPVVGGVYLLEDGADCDISRFGILSKNDIRDILAEIDEILNEFRRHQLNGSVYTCTYITLSMQ